MGMLSEADAGVCDDAGALRFHEAAALPLKLRVLIAGRSFGEKMEIKWDILLLLFCFRQSIFHWQ